MSNGDAATVTDQTLLGSLKRLVLDVTQVGLAPEQISDTADLFNDCGLDSTTVVDLVLAIEQQFHVTVDDEELDVHLFQNLSRLADLIQQKRTA